MAPAEEELVLAVVDSDLLHADETSWPEHGQPLWLWVFRAALAFNPQMENAFPLLEIADAQFAEN